MLDFGYTSAALINNIGLLRVDPSKIQAKLDAMIKKSFDKYPPKKK